MQSAAPEDLSADDLNPNAKRYAIMARPAEAVIARALKWAAVPYASPRLLAGSAVAERRRVDRDHHVRAGCPGQHQPWQPLALQRRVALAHCRHADRFRRRVGH